MNLTGKNLASRFSLPKRHGLCVVAVFLLMGLVTAQPAAAASFQGLGTLPGGLFGSFASDISADGRVVVDGSPSASGDEAFRWTQAGVYTSAMA